MVAFAGDHFGRGVARASTRSLQCVTLLFVSVAQAEVDNLDVHILVEKQVLRLQVAMANLDLVEVLDASEDLVEEPARFAILQSSLLDDVLEKFASAGILHYQEELFGRFDDFIQLHDVRVSNDFQNVNLSHHSRDVSLVFDFIFLEDLDGNLLMSQLVYAFTHFSKSTRADSFSCKKASVKKSESQPRLSPTTPAFHSIHHKSQIMISSFNLPTR